MVQEFVAKIDGKFVQFKDNSKTDFILTDSFGKAEKYVSADDKQLGQLKEKYHAEIIDIDTARKNILPSQSQPFDVVIKLYGGEDLSSVGVERTGIGHGKSIKEENTEKLDVVIQKNRDLVEDIDDDNLFDTINKDKIDDVIDKYSYNELDKNEEEKEAKVFSLNTEER